MPQGADSVRRRGAGDGWLFVDGVLLRFPEDLESLEHNICIRTVPNSLKPQQGAIQPLWLGSEPIVRFDCRIVQGQQYKWIQMLFTVSCFPFAAGSNPCPDFATSYFIQTSYDCHDPWSIRIDRTTIELRRSSSFLFMNCPCQIV